MLNLQKRLHSQREGGAFPVKLTIVSVIDRASSGNVTFLLLA